MPKPALLLIPLAALGVALALPARATAPLPEPPAMPAPADARPQVAVLAGGCFWGMEGLFEHVRGVISVRAGYAGGRAETANYPAVGTETTGHAESIRITFDPRRISYGQLLKIYFAVAHDPTQLNRQTPDEGPSYRSAIFPQNPAQRQVASAYIAMLNQAHVFARPIATRIENGTFYPAEDYHQHFMQRNPRHPYILAWDVAKLAKLKAAYPQFYREGWS
ncbi:MAG: peptide-methionine (S)-S-oxide reductase MsrA [Proteobacteria bacterium]|nr:peptide-methionine (S)-S-oxide reductase MsrA [Pseudomonadota bacterium]